MRDRDTVAAAALQGMLAAGQISVPAPWYRLAAMAYEAADAMLAERDARANAPGRQSDSAPTTACTPMSQGGESDSKSDWRGSIPRACAVRWVPVSEWMPTPGDVVWAYDGTDVLMVEYWSTGGFRSYGASCDPEGLSSESVIGITHWMEISEPEPPR